MRYRLTCLTPLLVGDGRKLSPIDYMVWKDHVNVLDQWRIFRLLAKGPRLDGYLAQLKKADKLDFASWGGFAQNFAGRRIPFENAAYPAYWNRAMGESLHIPTFAAGASGPYLPGAPIKGALRTGMLFANWRDGMLQSVLERVSGERLPRRPAEMVEEQALGSPGSNRMRFVAAADSGTIDASNFKVYLLRTSTLQPRGSQYVLGWKQSPRGAVDGARPEESTPVFAEMAAPGSVFEGEWREKKFFLQPEIRRALRWPESFDRGKIFEAANIYAAGLLAVQRNYAAMAGLGLLDKNLEELEQRLARARETGTCLLALGWGGGLLAKSSWLDTTNPEYRQILQQFTLYSRALSSNLPFPKTRRIVFLNNRPATLPGWAELSVE
ncbi:MAG TPA: type III-A CRISPR-associated RAMP protein Csm5 [Bryobacteraceae bacterium]|nr:type III-A CRISPR-associated RAMP protein Csm5 [Bryobacteraceae bacterium]